MDNAFKCFELKKELLSQIDMLCYEKLPHEDMVQSSFDSEQQRAVLTLEVAGTMYEGRSQRLENHAVGESVQLVRDPANSYNSNTIAVLNKSGDSLGNMPSEISDTLSPLIDEKYAVIENAHISYLLPLSQRSKRARKAILYITFSVKLEMPTYSGEGCMVCFLGGDQTKIWTQKLDILHCIMTQEDAALIFEMYNRMHDEYNPCNNDTFYSGLENLEQEVITARMKMRSEMKSDCDYACIDIPDDEEHDEGCSFYRFAMMLIQAEPQRYGQVEQFVRSASGISTDSDCFRSIFQNNSFEEETLYWTEYTRVSEEEFDEYSGAYSHWYDVAELFGSHLPVDFSDPDVQSIFGTNAFLTLADLSYGC